jgi:hypothetical protein
MQIKCRDFNVKTGATISLLLFVFMPDSVKMLFLCLSNSALRHKDDCGVDV